MVQVAYLKNRQEGQPQQEHLATLRAPGRKDATGAAGRLQDKSEGVLVDGTFDEWPEGASNA